MAAHDAISLTTAMPSSSMDSSSSSSFCFHSRSSAAMRAATHSRSSGADFDLAAASAMNFAAAAATCGDRAAAAAGKACLWQNCFIALSFMGRPRLAPADASAAVSWNSPKYRETPRAFSAAGAAYTATAPAAAADLPTFSIFSLGASAKIASTTSLSADSPGVAGGALPSPSSLSFLCFLVGWWSGGSTGPLAATNAAAKSSAAALAVAPHDPPSSASASSIASDVAASPTAFNRAYSSGSSTRRSSSRSVSAAWGTTHVTIIRRSAALRASSVAASPVSAHHAAVRVDLSRVAESTDSRLAKASATAASLAAFALATTTLAPTIRPRLSAHPSRVDAWRVTSALASRSARLAAIHSSSDVSSGSKARHRFSIELKTD